jgi:hypothetical protein
MSKREVRRYRPKPRKARTANRKGGRLKPMIAQAFDGLTGEYYPMGGQTLE